MEPKESKFSVESTKEMLEAKVDTNQDGQAVLTARIYFGEAVQELIKRGKKIEGAKVVDIDFDNSKLSLIVDTDQDGERMLEIELDLMEAFDEATSLIK